MFFDLRACAPNLDYWYCVALGTELTAGRPLAASVWGQSVVLFRDPQGQVQALEDRCPHRQVRLSAGQVIDGQLECAYHGWRFDSRGQCVQIPYLEKGQKIPPCQIRNYPVREQDGFIWLYPGDLAVLAQTGREPLALPEWEHLNYIGSCAPFSCPGHFSFLIENLMDMHHGHLHDQHQAWAGARLEKIAGADEEVTAYYQAQSYYKIDKIWSISQLFFPALRRLHPDPLTVSYAYPHWRATLGADFKIYCLFCPVSPTETKAYLVHFTSLEAFPKLHQSPLPIRRFLKTKLSGTARPLLKNLIRQDVAMIAQEQEAFLTDPQRRSYEVNPAIAQTQKLIRRLAPERRVAQS
ncbi:MAG: Rieske 2Fe-2S domain-containing protein [Cyanobacteria bacterium RI_101]|nr:Rieske 2Fe-2S domain-containing protein [Cyanobacteria bacterium RI_101]